MGDFNCTEVCQEEWYTNGSESSYGNKLSKLAMDNALTQWIREDTRFSNEGETSRLDLVFSKEPEGIKDVMVNGKQICFLFNCYKLCFVDGVNVKIIIWTKKTVNQVYFDNAVTYIFVNKLTN